MGSPGHSTSGIRYGSLRTPVGRIWIAARGPSVVRIALSEPDASAFLASLPETGDVPPVTRRRGDDDGALSVAFAQIGEYFAGRRRAFSVPVDLEGLTPFTREVLAATARIPYGQVASYGAIAARIGRPAACRAVGNALGANPVPIIVPCHRVLATGGGIGGFGGGVHLKRRLLAVEGWDL